MEKGYFRLSVFAIGLNRAYFSTSGIHIEQRDVNNVVSKGFSSLLVASNSLNNLVQRSSFRD